MRHILLTFALILFSAPSWSNENLHALVYDGLLLSCYDQNKKTILTSEACQPQVKPPLTLEIIEKKLGTNVLGQLIKQPQDYGPPCEGTLYFDNPDIKKTGSKQYPMTVLQTNNELYQNKIFDYIKSTYPNFKDRVFRLNQLVKVDLNKDGKDEIIFSIISTDTVPSPVPANSPRTPIFLAPPEERNYPAGKNYTYLSAVGIRYLDQQQKVQTKLIIEDRFDEKEQKAQHKQQDLSHVEEIHSLAGFTDLDHDGTLEIILHHAYYEGFSASVYKVKLDKGIFESLSSNGCGA